MTLLYFLLALGLLVFVHEFGHFLAAKRQGIGVEKFSFGFGPKLVSLQWGETTYLISALPMGGYVKLKGEDPASAEAADPKSYSSRPARQRFRVVFAGPLMNLLLALAFMPVVFMIGRSEPAFYQEPPVISQIEKNSPAEQAKLLVGDRILKIGEEETPDWHAVLQEVVLRPRERVVVTLARGRQIVEASAWLGADEGHQGGVLGVEPSLFIGQEAIVDGLIPGGPAERAGILPGDRIVSIDGEPVKNWGAMARKIHASGDRLLRFEVRQTEGKRSQPIRRLQLRPDFDKEAKRWVIGIQKDWEKRGVPMVERRFPLLEAIRLGAEENWRLAGMTLSVLGRLVTLKLSYKTLGGPIRIAQASASAAKGGISAFLYFLAFLSLQLGLLNLLPIPVLDGGHLLFMGLEGLAGRPLPMKLRLAAEQAGFVLLVGLMVLVTLHDVDSVWGLQQIMERIQSWF